MKLIAPDYYRDFACLMGDCRHSCCIGWEIDIDEDTRDFYRTVPGEIGDRLAENITDGEDASFFRLTAGDRCPFLNCEGLCDLILTLGEDSLCQICADHPRFRSFFSDRTEIGLGLCCEAAGHLILSHAAPVALEVLGDNGEDGALSQDEQILLSLRSELLSIAQDRTMSTESRLKRILDRFDLPLPCLETEFLLSLERLDEAWTLQLEELSEQRESIPLPENTLWETTFEQLLVYLIYRHLPAALNDRAVPERVSFIAAAWQLVRSLCAAHLARHGDISLDNMVEIARLYSSEIEYSDENIFAILEKIR